MYYISIVYYLLFLLFQPTINNYVLIKENVLSLTDAYYTSFYCLNNLCVSMDVNYESTIKFPNKDGTFTEYIADTCTLKKINSNECYGLKCENDTQCLYNKCTKNYCTFNKDAGVEHCDNIYSNSLFSGRKTYMYCGKASGESCFFNRECSSKNCVWGQSGCAKQLRGPSDSENVTQSLQLMLILGLTVLIIVCSCLCCWCTSPDKKKNDKNKSALGLTIIALILLIIYIGY